VLIEGTNHDGRYDSNGSGKSTLLEGIVYALTGNTLRNVSVGDIVNRNIGKNTMSHLTLHKDAVKLDVRRYRKDDEKGDSLLVEKDGKDVSARLNKDTQAIIDNELGVPYKVLTNTILLGEGLSSRFTQLSDLEKKSLIESTLALSYDLGKVREYVNNKLKEMRLEVSRLSGSISTLKTMVENPTDHKSVTEYKVCLQSTIDIRNDLSSQLDEVSREVMNLQGKLTVLTEAKTTVETFHQEIFNLKQQETDIEYKLHSLDVETPHCELCGQSLSNEETKATVKGKYILEKDGVISKIQDFNRKLTQYPPLDTISSHMTLLTEKREETNKLMTDLQDRLMRVSQDIYRIEQDIQYAEKIRGNLSESKKQLESETAQVSALESSMKDYDYLSRLFSPSGIINYILEEAVAYINERLTVYTDLLIDKSYKLALSKGKMVLEDAKGSSYQSLSNGEKRRLDICIQFSLHDYVHNYCGIKLDTLFIDEVLDTLDKTGTENIIDVIRLKMDYCKLKRVLVITHNQDLKSKFDKVITVSKDEDGNSRLV
jgi:DNA repair exonuclease SbcCD ATPase subunit